MNPDAEDEPMKSKLALHAEAYWTAVLESCRNIPPNLPGYYEIPRQHWFDNWMLKCAALHLMPPQEAIDTWHDYQNRS